MKKGFTLVEIAVTLAIFSVITACIFLVMSSTRSMWYSSDSSIQLQQELRKALSQISDDLKQSSVNKIFLDSSLTLPFPNDGASYSTIVFFLNQGVDGSGVVQWSANPISYSLSGNQVIRTNQDGSTAVVANQISGLSFVRQVSDPNVVSISLGAQTTNQIGQTATASLDTEVAFRN